jgi:hypothetical protein
VVVKCQKEPHTSAEENSRSRIKYKLFLGFLKIIPMLMAGLFLLNTVLSYFGIDYSIISYLTGVGLIPWLFILAASYTLRFCEYHRMFLHYVVVNDLLSIYDYHIGIPISDIGLFLIHIILTGVALYLILYMHQKQKHVKCFKGTITKNCR